MPGLVIGGFYIKDYESTRSWGIEPSSASGTGVVNLGGTPSIQVGSFVAFSLMGVTYYGIVSMLERVVSRESGDEYSFQIVDNRIRLRWSMVFGQWNMEEDASKNHSDPVVSRGSALDNWHGSALDELSGGEVGFDQGVDFVGGIESDMGSPRPTRTAGSSSRGRMYSDIPPAHWAMQMKTLHEVPRTAAEILSEAARGSKGGGGGIGFSFHAVQLSTPVFGVDANSGVSLAGLIQQLADAQGLQCTLDGTRTLRFERRGSGTAGVPPDAYVSRQGSALSTEPTKVRVVGGRRLVQVNEVPLGPDWNRGWEEFMAEPAWLDEVASLALADGPPPPDSAAQRAEIAARAREITLREYIDRKGLAGGDPADLESGFADNGRWGTISRMDMPVWDYLNKILFRSYRIPEDAELYGMPLRSLDISEGLLCAVETREIGDDTRTVYRENPLEFYPQSAAFVLAKGQPLDLQNPEQAEALIRLRSTDLNQVWSEVSDFTLDAENHAVRFSTPVFLDGEAHEGRSILLYPNRGQDGGEDLSETLEEGDSYLDIVVPNPGYVIEPAEVRVALVFKLGLFYRDFGSGVRWTSYHAPAIAEHLLHGADGFSPDGAAAYDGSAGVPEPPAEGFLEVLYDDGGNAMDAAEAQSSGLVVRSGVEASGEYVRVGAAGTSLSGSVDRVTIRISREGGLVETVSLAKPRATRGFISSREIADRLKNEELFEGQKELAREVLELRAIARAHRLLTTNEKSRASSHEVMTDVFRKPVGIVDSDVRTIKDVNAAAPAGGWRAGHLVWFDSEGLPSAAGGVFGGVVVMTPALAAEGGEVSDHITVATAGVVPVLVAPGTPSGPVSAEPGESYAAAGGSYPIGMLAHSNPVPGTGPATLALVRLGGGGGAASTGPCYFGEIVTWSDDSGSEPVMKTGLRGGVIEVGANKFYYDDIEIDGAEGDVSMLYFEIPVLVNTSVDGVATLSGVKSGTKATLTLAAYGSSDDYPASVIPPIFPGVGETPGEGMIVLPVGIVTVVSVSAGGFPTLTLEPTGCGHFVVTHCPGVLSYYRRGGVESGSLI